MLNVLLYLFCFIGKLGRGKIWWSILSSMKGQIQSVSLSFLSDKYEEVKEKVSLPEESNKGLKMENSFLSNELAKATNEIKNLRDLRDEFEQYGKQCLDVRGIPQLHGENTGEIVMKIGSKVGVVIKQEDISVRHRLLFKEVMLRILTQLL